MIAILNAYRYRMLIPVNRTTRVLAGLTAALLLALVWAAASGALGISLWEVLRGQEDPFSVQVWWQLRLPRLLLGVAVGDACW